MNEESIFAAALEKKSPEERKAFLDESCRGNAELRAQVEELLSASAAAGSFFEHPPAGLDVTVDAAAANSDTHKSANWDGSLAFLKPAGKPGRIGKLVGNAGEYEIIEVVGSGGMGIVLRAFDTKLSRVVAVKVLAPELARNPTAVRRFLREAKAAAAVVHDHVVTIHNVEESHQPPFLVMQFVDGQTLQQKIDRDGALELKEILRIGCQAAAGLAAAHKHGLVHRDVKPSNILLENGVERVKITDFGLARAADDVEITQTGLIAGTPQYMSPEQAKGEPLDARSDLFSLGSVLYTMCAGRPAFRADTTMGVIRRVCDDEPRPISEVNAEIPPWLETIVSKLLAKDPGERFQSGAEVSDLLGQCLAHVQNPSSVPLPGICLSAVPSVAKEVKPVPLAARRRKFPLAIAVALLVLCLPMVALVAMIVASFAARYFHAHSAEEEAVLTLLVPRPTVEVTYNGDKIAVTDRGLAVVHVQPGTYEIRTMKGGEVASFDLHTLRRGEQFSRKISDAADAVHINGPLHPDDVLQRLADGGGPAFPAKGPWVSLFNGQDLTGWKTHPDQPGNWKVDANGVLVGTGPGSHLFSERGDYQDFHLRVEAKVNGSGANGGVWFRTSYGFPRKLDWGMGIPDGYEAEIYSGPATWKTGSLTRIQSWTRDLIKPNEWFTLEVIAEGRRLRLKVNGVTTVDTVDASGATRGHIALQVLYNNTVLQVRKAEIRELTSVSGAADATKGWQQLFNGKDLAGWKSHSGLLGGWEVKQGLLTGSAQTGYLFSEREYGNFHLRAEVKTSDRGDAGIFFRAPFALRKGTQAWMIQPAGGYEAELYNSPQLAGTLWEIVPEQAPGLLASAKGSRLARPDEWFTLEIIAEDNHFITKVNGQEVVSARDKQSKYARGHVVLSAWGQDTVVQFRKIEIKELPAGAAVLQANQQPTAILWGEVKDGCHFGVGFRHGKLRYSPDEKVELELMIRNTTDAEKTIEIRRPQDWSVEYEGGDELSVRPVGAKKKLTLAPHETHVIEPVPPEDRGEPAAIFPEKSFALASHVQIKTDGLTKGFYRVEFLAPFADKSQPLSDPSFGFHFDGPEPQKPELTGTSSKKPLNLRDHEKVVWGKPVLGLSLGIGPAKDREGNELTIYLWNTTARAVNVQHVEDHPLGWQLLARDAQGREHRPIGILTGPKSLGRKQLGSRQAIEIGTATLDRQWSVNGAPSGKLAPSTFQVSTVFDCRRLDYGHFHLRLTSGEARVEIK